MRSFLLSKVAIPLHLAFIAGYLACVSVKPDGIIEYLPLAWFVAGLIEITLLFPSARKGEEVYDARRRVRKSILKDPVLVLGIIGFLFILIQTLNGPRPLKYDTLSSSWQFAAAKIKDFPACIDQLKSVQGLFWNLIIVSSILVIRNGIGKKGRILLLKYLVIISSLLSLYGLITYVPAAQDAPISPFATFPTPITAGIYFCTHFCISCSLFATELGKEESDRWQKRILFISCVLNLAGTVYSLSCISLVLAAFTLLVNVIYGSIYLGNRIPSAQKLKMMATALILIGFAVFIHCIAYPNNRIHERIDKIVSMNWETEQEAIERGTLAKVATRIIKENKIHGVGTWGYADQSCFGKFIEDDEWDNLLSPDSKYSTCGNDWLQFIAEYGYFGMLLFISPFIFLVGISVYRIVMDFIPKAKRNKDPNSTSSENETIPFIERISPNTFALFWSVLLPLVVSFRYSVFRYPLVLLTWTIFLTVFSTFLPKPVSLEAKK